MRQRPWTGGGLVLGAGLGLALWAALPPRQEARAGPHFDPIIHIRSGREEVGCLRALLHDPATRAALHELLTRGSVWHVGSTPSEKAFRYAFSWAGRRRTSTRVLQALFTVEPRETGDHTVSAPAYRIGALETAGKPVLREAEHLEVLRAALDHEDLIRSVLALFEPRARDIERIHVEEAAEGGGLRLTFTAGEREGAPALEFRCAVVRDAAGYTFLLP